VTSSTEHAVHRIERDHCLEPSRTVDAPICGARYGRMFADLPALITDVADLESAGKPGGVPDRAPVVVADTAAPRRREFRPGRPTPVRRERPATL